MEKDRKKARPWGFLLFVMILVGFWYWNTFTLAVTRVELHSGKIKNPVKIVLISDLHDGVFGRDNETLLQKIRKETPDFVAVVGDMYTAGSKAGACRAEALLGRLAEEFPTYYVNGEHDNSEAFFEKLEDEGVQFLDYEQKTIQVEDTVLSLYGITNVYYSPTFDLSNAFTLDEAHYSILLAHIENFRAFSRFGVDLALCGDTHGGQVRLPFVGAIYNGGYWFPELKPGSNCEFTKGLYQRENTSLFITGGLGSYPVPLRLFNRPEVAVITLLPEK